MKIDDIVIEARGGYLPKKIENSLKEFIHDAHNMGIPRTKARCAEDIQQYVIQNNIQVPYTNGKPG